MNLYRKKKKIARTKTTFSVNMINMAILTMEKYQTDCVGLGIFVEPGSGYLAEYI